MYSIQDGSDMIEYSKGNLLKDAYYSISDGISNIESYLPRVENEDMNIPPRQVGGAQQPSNSFEYKSQVGYGKATNTDQFIAQEVVSEIQHRVEWIRKFADNSSSEAVSSIAMEIIEEEENHMDWMKSYVD